MCGRALIRCFSADRQQLPEQRRLIDGTAATPIIFNYGSTVHAASQPSGRHCSGKGSGLHRCDGGDGDRKSPMSQLSLDVGVISQSAARLAVPRVAQ